QVGQIIRGDVTGDVIAVEARRFELLELRVCRAHRRLQCLQILVNKKVCPDLSGNLSLGAAGCDELPLVGHIDAIDIRVAHWRTDLRRIAWPGMMNVRPMYRFLTKPSRYFRPRLLASSNAEGRLESGIGITTSMSCASGMPRIFLASCSPIRSRDSYTEVPSITESGRAR